MTRTPGEVVWRGRDGRVVTWWPDANYAPGRVRGTLFNVYEYQSEVLIKRLREKLAENEKLLLELREGEGAA